MIAFKRRLLAFTMATVGLSTAAAAKTGEAERWDAFVAAVVRVNDVAWRLRTANAELCGTRARWSQGIAAGTVWDLPSSLQVAAETALGFDRRMRVLAVAAGSPAAEAGIRAGDRIAAIDGSSLGSKPTVSGLRNGLDRPAPALELHGPDGQARSVVLASRRICDVDMQVLASFGRSLPPAPNAATLGLETLQHIGSDDDLAFLLAHDVAHVLLDHFRNKSDDHAAAPAVSQALALALGVPSLAGGGNPLARPYGPAREAEADMLAVTLMRAAGYDAGGVPELLARHQRAYGEANVSLCMVGHPCNHPVTEARIRALGPDGAAPASPGAALPVTPPSREALSDFLGRDYGPATGPERGLFF